MAQRHNKQNDTNGDNKRNNKTNTIIKKKQNFSSKDSTDYLPTTNYLEDFQKWIKQFKLKINKTKTKAILFSKQMKNIRRRIKIENAEILWEEEAKYLGITFDRKLTRKSTHKKLITKIMQ